MSGECVVTRWETLDRQEQLRIDRADSTCLIADEMLDRLAERGWFGEGIFVIRAHNGTVRYELTERLDGDVWLATRITPWPAPDAVAGGA